MYDLHTNLLDESERKYKTPQGVLPTRLEGRKFSLKEFGICRRLKNICLQHYKGDHPVGNLEKLLFH